MPWRNVTNTQVQITGNIPNQRCFTIGYIVWKGAFQTTAALEREVATGTATSPVQLTADPSSASGQQFAAQFQQNIGNNMTAGFELNSERARALVQSARGSGASPLAFGNALLNCIAIKQQLNIMGVQVTVGIQADTDLCFYSIQVPLTQWHPEFPSWFPLGQGVRTRGNFQGKPP